MSGHHLRILVKRILRRYGCTPDKQEKATRTVLEQAEALSTGWATAQYQTRWHSPIILEGTYSMHPFLQSWSDWQPGRPPFFLESDKVILKELAARGRTVLHTTWESYRDSENVADRSDSRLHLGLIPQPFFGDPSSAKIVILTLNPGLNPHDYFAEYETGFAEVLLAVLKGERRDFIFLDSDYSWHSGFTYWYTRLAKTIDAFANKHSIGRAKAIAWFRDNLAVLELLPYHSARMGLTDHKLRRFHSVALVKAFVAEDVLPRALAGQCLLIVARAVKRWGFEKQRSDPNIVIYSGNHSRSSSLDTKSAGGKAILRLTEP